MLLGEEEVKNPIANSDLNIKGLADFGINIATGCLFGCPHCYVPSTPVVRHRFKQLQERGIKNPIEDWGDYLLLRKKSPELIKQIIGSKRFDKATEAGRGIFLLCPSTDPYQNLAAAKISSEIIVNLLENNKRVRVLTRSPLWVEYYELLKHPNAIVGASIPYLDDDLGKLLEPNAPRTSDKLKALIQGADKGVRTFVAMAPTPLPLSEVHHFEEHLKRLLDANPECIFWEFINPRGQNFQRMAQEKGITWAIELTNKKTWAKAWIRQWENALEAADKVGCSSIFHVWPDKNLIPYLKEHPCLRVEPWLFKKSPETWG